jgi:protein-L-isoaspartate(D-aspartate) O-methyltransferase
MVEQQIARRGIGDARILAAMRDVPREAFVPANLQGAAYEDRPLPIAAGQTISQPYIVALMIELAGIEPGKRVLEVGAGSGYAAAVMAQIAGEVFAIERHGELAEQAEATITRLGYENIHLRCGDGTRGWPEEAPFDAIVVSAGGVHVPQALKAQLARQGRLVIPLGNGQQRLVRVTREDDDEFTTEEFDAVNFVPLVGDQA